MDPFRIEAVDRLVEHQRLRDRRAARVAIPSRWPMPSENWPARLCATSRRPTRSISSSTRRRGMPCVWARASRWLYAERPRVHGARLQQGADLVQRRRMLAVVLAVHLRVAGRRRVEPEHQPHRRRLPRAVRAEETGDDAGPHRERQIVDGALVAVVLGEIARLDQAAKNVAVRSVTPAPHENRLTQRQHWLNRGRVQSRRDTDGMDRSTEGLRPDEAFEGRIVRVEPIEERHREGLREAAEQEPQIHRYTGMYSLGFDRWFDEALGSETEVPFVVHRRRHGPSARRAT